VSVAVDLRPSPPALHAPASFLARVRSGRVGHEAPVTGARVSIVGRMAHPGMRALVAAAPEAAPGDYRATLTFDMAGTWDLAVEATLRDGQRVAQSLRVDVAP
jgi:hypothetical protein